LGETTPADAGQTTSTESLSTDAALAELVPTDASAPEASTDASAPEAGATTPETPTDLKPGEAKPVVIKELWHEGAVDGYRERWHQVQVGFLDDPQEAATQAEALLDDVLEGLRTALADRKSELDSWSSTTGQHDTEEMRVTVRGYRDLLDRLLTF
jgi:predicted lipid-binding transport protein (Tim44 family)